MADRIKALEKENKELRKTIEELEDEGEEIVRKEEEERASVIEEHIATRAQYKEQITILKIELDKVLSTKV